MFLDICNGCISAMALPFVCLAWVSVFRVSSVQYLSSFSWSLSHGQTHAVPCGRLCVRPNLFLAKHIERTKLCRPPRIIHAGGMSVGDVVRKSLPRPFPTSNREVTFSRRKLSCAPSVTGGAFRQIASRGFLRAMRHIPDGGSNVSSGPFP